MNLIITMVSYISADISRQKDVERYINVESVEFITDKLYEMQKQFSANSINTWKDYTIFIKLALNEIVKTTNKEIISYGNNYNPCHPFIWIDDPYIFDYEDGEIYPYEERDDHKIYKLINSNKLGNIKDYLDQALRMSNEKENKDDDSICCLILPINFIDRENPMCIINPNDIL